MEHISDKNLLDMISGKLPKEKAALLVRHAKQCEQCRLRLQQLKQGWDFLGTWELKTPETDMSAVIMARLDNTNDAAADKDNGNSNISVNITDDNTAESSDSKRNSVEVIRFFGTGALIRVAASVIIGLSTGLLAYRTISQSANTPSAEQQLAESIYMDVLVLNSATGLGDSVLQNDSSGEVY